MGVHDRGENRLVISLHCFCTTRSVFTTSTTISRPIFRAARNSGRRSRGRWRSHCIVFARQGRSSRQARRFPGPSFGRPGTAAGDRAGAGGALSQGARPRRRRDGAAASLHLTDLASLSQARQVDRGTPALALSEGHLHGRFLRGACGALGARGAGALGLDHCPPQGGLARRAGALATARSLGQASCLLLGRRRLLLTTARP